MSTVYVVAYDVVALRDRLDDAERVLEEAGPGATLWAVEVVQGHATLTEVGRREGAVPVSPTRADLADVADGLRQLAAVADRMAGR